MHGKLLGYSSFLSHWYQGFKPIGRNHDVDVIFICAGKGSYGQSNSCWQVKQMPQRKSRFTTNKALLS